MKRNLGGKITTFVEPTQEPSYSVRIFPTYQVFSYGKEVRVQIRRGAGDLGFRPNSAPNSPCPLEQVLESDSFIFLIVQLGQ